VPMKMIVWKEKDENENSSGDSSDKN